nr:MAG TPA: hypothetical protein [Caudoviricetes sp.]
MKEKSTITFKHTKRGIANLLSLLRCLCISLISIAQDRK